jgi:hypothetical protein
MKKLLLFLLILKISNASFAQKKIIKYNISSGNPDTSLAVFLWKKSYEKPIFSNCREEFIRWDLENEKISKIIYYLYNKNMNYSNNVQVLENYKNLFVTYSRKEVIKEYRNYHSIIDVLEFDYLIKRKDSLIVPLIKKSINDKKFDDNEKKKLKLIISNL